MAALETWTLRTTERILKKAASIFFPIFTEKYILEDPKNYTFLTSGFVTVQNQDDAEEFAATMEAMKIMVIKPKF